MAGKCDSKWVENFKCLTGYIDKYNKLPKDGIASSLGTDLNSWLRYQKRYFKNGTMERWKIEMFEEYDKGVLTKTAREFDNSLICSRPINIPNKEYDITVVELFSKGIISSSDYIKFVRNNQFYFSDIIKVNGSKADIFIKGIRLIGDIPDYKWCGFYCILFCDESPESLYLKDKGEFINYYCKEFRKLESKYFTIIEPNINYTERENIIINMYFGLSGKRLSLHDIAKMFDVTCERVRQIAYKTARKTRIFLYGYGVLNDKEDAVTVSDYCEVEDDEIDYYTCSLSLLGLSTRACNCLKREGVDSLKELHEFLMENNYGVPVMDRLLFIRNLGRRCREEICDVVAKYGLTDKVFSSN